MHRVGDIHGLKITLLVYYFVLLLVFLLFIGCSRLVGEIIFLGCCTWLSIAFKHFEKGMLLLTN